MRDDLQHAQFGLAVEAVTGLGFDGGGSGAKHPVAMATGAASSSSSLAARVSCNGAQNAPARRGDLLIRCSGDALLKLCRTIAGKNQVGVRVDESRRDAFAPASITTAWGGISGRSLT